MIAIGKKVTVMKFSFTLLGILVLLASIESATAGEAHSKENSLEKRIQELEQEIQDKQYQSYMDRRVYEGRQNPGVQPVTYNVPEKQRDAVVDVKPKASEPIVLSDVDADRMAYVGREDSQALKNSAGSKTAFESRPQNAVGSFENTSIMEESLPVLGDPDDRPGVESQDRNGLGLLESKPEKALEDNRPEIVELPREQLLYQQAMHFIAQQRPDLAQEHLDEIVASFSNTPEAVLAQYWLGEMMLEAGNQVGASVAYGRAYGAYKSLKKRKLDLAAFHGEEEKLPEILYKLALSLKAIGKAKEACVTLSQIKKDFKALPSTLNHLVGGLKKQLKCG